MGVKSALLAPPGRRRPREPLPDSFVVSCESGVHLWPDTWTALFGPLSSCQPRTTHLSVKTPGRGRPREPLPNPFAVSCHPAAHMRTGSTYFGVCEVRCWRWLFGNNTPVSPVIPEPHTSLSRRLEILRALRYTCLFRKISRWDCSLAHESGPLMTVVHLGRSTCHAISGPLSAHT